MASSLKRIAWLSPYGPRSDIGAFTRNLLPHLTKPLGGSHFDVHLWVNENGPTYPSEVPQLGLSAQPHLRHVLGLYDFAVFNVGNNVENHLHIAGALKNHAGVLIFHDFVYQHFFAHECFEGKKSPAAYARLMGELYGRAALELIHHSGIWAPGQALYAPWDSNEVARYPMFELMTGLAAAVVVHSEFAYQQVRRKYGGPILKLALPFDQKSMLSDSEVQDWRQRTRHKQRLLFTSFGHISRGKLLDRVLLAFAASDYLRHNARLLIAGHPGDVGYVEELRAAVKGLQLQEQVTIELSVSDERLLQIKADTDIFVNLRYPNTEAGSGSLTEQLNTGRPVIVHASGCYADVPDGAAVKWVQEAGVERLTAEMEELARNPARRASVGQEGRRHVQCLGGSAYAGKLKEFLLESDRRIHMVQAFLGDVPSSASAVEEVAEAGAIRATRDLWQSLEIDAYCYSPAPFLRWPPEAAAALASTLVTPRRRATFETTARRRLAEDPIGFYEDLCRIRTGLRVASAWESGAPEAPESRPVMSPPFWDLVLLLVPRDVARLLHVCLARKTYEEATLEVLAEALTEGVPPSLVLWTFVQSPLVEPASEQERVELAGWALREPRRLPYAQRVRRFLANRGVALGADDRAAIEAGDFDEEDYLRRYPDVAVAVACGAAKSGFDHFVRYGQKEGRRFALKPVTIEHVSADDGEEAAI